MRRKKYRHRGPHGRRRKQFRSRKSSGWGMNLYRNTREGKIAGVAAGLADYFDVAPWVVRLLWATPPWEALPWATLERRRMPWVGVFWAPGEEVEPPVAVSQSWEEEEDSWVALALPAGCRVNCPPRRSPRTVLAR